jgi:uncharacterized protein YwgA
MRQPQISTTITPEMFVEIQKIAEKERRSISLIASDLIFQALKERERNRLKNKKRSKVQE